MVIPMIRFIKQCIFLKGFLHYDTEFSSGLSSEVELLYACLTDVEINAGRLSSTSQTRDKDRRVKICVPGSQLFNSLFFMTVA